jgi:Scd6-like Sm domain-containing protein
MSYGTEERRTGEEFFPPSSSLYDYILFRGKDVKDLRIEEEKKDQPTPQPPMPNDPAILGVSSIYLYAFYIAMMKYLGCKLYCLLNAHNPMSISPLPSF